MAPTAAPHTTTREPIPNQQTAPSDKNTPDKPKTKKRKSKHNTKHRSHPTNTNGAAEGRNLTAAEEPNTEDTPTPPSPTLTIIAIPENAMRQEAPATPYSPPNPINNGLPGLIPPGEGSPGTPTSPTPQPQWKTPVLDLWQPAPLPGQSSATTPQTTPPGEAQPPHIPSKTSLKALLALGGVRPTSTSTPDNPTRDVLGKYLDVEMPEIHDAHASALIDLIDSDLLDEWDIQPDRKLAIIPFGVEIHSQDQLRNLREQVFTAIGEITKSQMLGILALKPNEKAITLR